MSGETFFMLANVRVSFPHLFVKPTINGELGKYGANFLFDIANDPKHRQTVVNMMNHGKTLVAGKLNGARIPDEKWCLREGKKTSRPEYDPFWILSTNTGNKPVVLDRTNPKLRIMEAENCPIYSGCRVNAKVRMWAQDNKFGKRINGELIAIQFFADDKPLDGTYIDPETAVEGFEGFDQTADGFGDGFGGDLALGADLGPSNPLGDPGLGLDDPMAGLELDLGVPPAQSAADILAELGLG